MRQLMITGADVQRALRAQELHQQISEKLTGINDSYEGSTHISDQDVEQVYELFKSIGATINIEDADNIPVNMQPLVNGGILTLARLLTVPSFRDPLSRALPFLDLIKPGYEQLVVFKRKYTGLPDIYTDYNDVPLLQEELSKSVHGIVDYQLAIQTLLREVLAAEAQQADGVLERETLEGKRKSVETLLLKVARTARNVGIPSLGVDGLYTSRDLPPAIDGGTWMLNYASISNTLETVLETLNRMMSRLASQLDVSVSDLNANLIIPEKYELLFSYPASIQNINQSIKQWVELNHRNITIIFNRGVPASKTDGNFDFFPLILAEKTVMDYSGGVVPAFFSPVNRTFVSKAASQVQVDLKRWQELFKVSTGGVVISDPASVVLCLVGTPKPQ